MLYFVLGFNFSYSQEFMHWKFLENKKTDRIKTETVWQYPVEDTSFQNKKLFSYHKFDCLERLIELRMYSTDTSFYLYTADGQRKKVATDGVEKEELQKTI